MFYEKISFKNVVGEALEELQQSLFKLFLGLSEMHQDSNSKERTVVPPPISTICHDSFEKALMLWRSHGLPLLSQLPKRACPACGEQASHTVFESYDGYMFHECHNCGMWYVPLMVTWALFERLFALCPEAEAVSRDVAVHRLTQLKDQDVARVSGYFTAIQALLPQGGNGLRYLDIGCSVGHSLQAAKDRGMLAFGVEVDPSAAEIAVKAGHTVVRTLEELPEGRYDIVSFWETLEHIGDPLSELQRAASRMNDNGLLVFTVPNLASLGVRVLREKCAYAYGGYNSPGHINFFSRASLSHLLQRAGLTLLDVGSEYSNNLAEIAGYLHCMTDPSRPFAVLSPPSDTAMAVNVVGPTVAMMEARTGTQPIIQCMACLSGKEARFKQALDMRMRVKAQQNREELLRKLKATPDLFSHAVVLPEGSLNRRERLIVKIYNKLEQWQTSLVGLLSPDKAN
jgi:SAM-dependent methyltransferase